MAEDRIGPYLLIVLAAVAVVGLGLAAASLVTRESMGSMMGFGGGMMEGNGGCNCTNVEYCQQHMDDHNYSFGMMG
jgi:hypothetical protein